MRLRHDALWFLCIECAANPLDGGVWEWSVDGHYVESARALIADSLHHEVVFGRCDETGSFARVNAVQPTTERATRSPPHLDEYESVGVAHHKVDLATPAPVVARDEQEALPGEKAFRKLFGVVSDGARAIGPVMISMVQHPCRPVGGARALRRRIAST